MKILVTGGCGFIGSNLIKRLTKKTGIQFINIDAHTYAARPPMYKKKPANLINEKVDIRDQLSVKRVMEKYRPDHIIHLAAESHVCKSILGPKDFVTTNINGTWNLLEEFKELWKNEPQKHRFTHVSTDEVFGQLGKTGQFTEQSAIAPRSPYAASKASSDHLVQAYHTTYGLDVVITNCSNNFGPNQHAEKLIPKTIQSILRGDQVEIYGTGKQVRDWIYVEDHCAAIELLAAKGKSGERYCIGGDTEHSNLEMVSIISLLMTTMFGRGKYEAKIVHTDSRPTDDYRYALDSSKLKRLGWKTNNNDFTRNLQNTIMWYYDRLILAEAGSRARTRG